MNDVFRISDQLATTLEEISDHLLRRNMAFAMS
jgi:hypothetical protein